MRARPPPFTSRICVAGTRPLVSTKSTPERAVTSVKWRAGRGGALASGPAAQAGREDGPHLTAPGERDGAHEGLLGVVHAVLLEGHQAETEDRLGILGALGEVALQGLAGLVEPAEVEEREPMEEIGGHVAGL